jgi:hypothetical protein
MVCRPISSRTHGVLRQSLRQSAQVHLGLQRGLRFLGQSQQPVPYAAVEIALSTDFPCQSGNRGTNGVPGLVGKVVDQSNIGTT